MVVECVLWGPRALWRESAVRKYWSRSVRGVGGRAGGCSNVWENVMKLFQDEGVWMYCVYCQYSGVKVNIAEMCYGLLVWVLCVCIGCKVLTFLG